jgi:DNA-binding response OmpR family regulator
MNRKPDTDDIRILIVDDDPVARHLYHTMLTTFGYEQVDTAASGELGLARLQQNDYQVVLLDKNMPGISGMDVLRDTQNLRPACQFIMVTGYNSDESAREALSLGVTDYQAKPTDIHELRSRVKAAAATARAFRLERSLPKEVARIVAGLKQALALDDREQRLAQGADLIRQLEGLCASESDPD